MALCDPEQMKVLKKLTKRGNKMGAKRVIIDGYNFMSQREGARYQELKLRFLAGDIAALELQPRFALHALDANNIKHELGCAIMDFRYVIVVAPHGRGVEIVEDVKGHDTRESKRKRKHVEVEYGIKVRIIK